MLTARQKIILQHILNSDTIISTKNIQETFRISTRTVKNELREINFFLKQQKLQSVQHIRNQGYFISPQDKVKISKLLKNGNKLIYFTPDNRVIRILFFILVTEEKFTVDELAESNLVTRNTTLNDIKKIKRGCQEFSLELLYDKEKGYSIFGEEKQISISFLSNSFIG